MFQVRLKGISSSFKGVSRFFERSSKEILEKVCQGSSKVVSRESHGGRVTFVPGVNIFHNSWIIIREKFPFFNPFGKSLSFGVFMRFVMNCKKCTKLPC